MPSETIDATSAAPGPRCARRDYGTTADGRAVFEHTLDNGRGLVLSVINFGAIVTALHCPDRSGRSANVPFVPNACSSFCPCAAKVGGGARDFIASGLTPRRSSFDCSDC